MVKPDLAATIDRSVFPGVQGGPLMHVIAAKAVGFQFNLTEEYRLDQQRTIDNAQVLAETLAQQGARLVSGGTDNHLMLVDVTPLGVTGKEAEHILDEIGVTVNKNAIPFDQNPPNIASGIRVGTPAVTTRGFGTDEMRAIGRIIISAITSRDEPAQQTRLAAEVREIVEPVPRPRAGRHRVTCRDETPVTFAPGIGAALPFLIGTLVLAAVLSFLLTPLVRAARPPAGHRGPAR